MPPPPQTFLDVPRLLQTSVPRQRSGWLGYGTGALLLVVLMAALLVARSDVHRNVTQLLSAGAMIGIVIGMWMYEIASGRDGSPYVELGAISGLVYLLAIGVLRVRR